MMTQRINTVSVDNKENNAINMNKGLNIKKNCLKKDQI